MTPRSRRPLGRFLITFGAIMIANGCGSGDPVITEDPTIALSLSPTSATVEQGESIVVTGTATVGGSFTGTASVSVQGVPTGVTGTIGAATTSGLTTTIPVTLDVTEATEVGEYTLTVRASGSGVTADATFALTVDPGGTLGLIVTPAELTIEQGTAGSADLEVSHSDIQAPVTLSAEGAPAGMTVSFDPVSPSGDASSVTVAVGGSVAPGTYDVTIRGEVPGTAIADATDQLSITVTEATGPSYSLSLDPDELVLDRAQPLGFVEGEGPARVSTGMVTVAVNRTEGHSATVLLELVDAPTGVVGVFDPADVTGGGSELTVSVGSDVEPGEYTVYVRGMDEGIAPRLAPLELTVLPTPSFEIEMVPGEVTVDQGAAVEASVSIERVNFDGAVTLVLEETPDGISGTFSTNPADGDASTLTLDVSESVEPGEYGISVRGEANGLPSMTVPLLLTVTEVSGFSLSAVAALTLQQGASGERTVTIERAGGFDASVTISTTPAVAGLTIELDPASTTGNSVTLTATAAMSLSPQTYVLEIAGNATGAPEATTSFEIVVTAASGSGVSLDYSTCSVDEQPVWVAYQDGTGTWTPVTGAGGVFEFDVSESVAGLAVVTAPDVGLSDLDIIYLTAAELTGGLYETSCDDTDPETKQVTFTASGVVQGEVGTLYLGGGTSFFAANGPGTVSNVPDGTYDAVGFVRNTLAAGSERVFVRRDQNVMDLGAIDFSLTGPEVVAAATGTITVGGLQGGETVGGAVQFNTSTASAACQPATLHSVQASGASTFTAYGFPGGSMESGDAHSISLSAFDGLTSTRVVTEDFETMGDRTIDLPVALPAPTITDLGGGAGPYKILQAGVVLPGEYDTSNFEYSANGRNVWVAASAGYFSTATHLLTVPDFTGVTGWNADWAPAASDEVEWSFSAIGGIFAERCTNGGRFVAATETGTQG